MFQNFKKDDDEQTRIDKNLKLMSISAVILIVLFIYTTLKSDTAIQGSGYYIGVTFLFVLLVLTFALQKYKDKIRAKIPKNKFQAQMETANSSNVKEKENYEEPASSIEAIHSNITFKDIAGIAEIKEELEEVVDFLNNPKKYQNLTCHFQRVFYW